MKARTDQTLEVLDLIWRRRSAIAIFRVDAEKEVARARGIEPETVHDKLVRQLGPAVANSAHFDRLIARWLGGDPAPLRQAIGGRVHGSIDEQRFDEFFRARLPAARPLPGISNERCS
jgi:hypothetical protein